MRLKNFICLRLPAWLAAWSASTLAAGAISVANLQAKLDKGEKLTVVDVRSQTFYLDGHIPGAINVPASLCAQKHLPPLGRVVVCGEGLGRDDTVIAAAELGKKPGISVDVLEGGFSAWEDAQSLTTKGRGMKTEALNYMPYEKLKAAKPEDVVLIDLRKQLVPAKLSVGGSAAASQPLTDLSAEFPGLRHGGVPSGAARSAKIAAASGPTPVMVLIDNGDGAAQAVARSLKASGNHRYVILAGGELILARHGQAGLERNSLANGLPAKKLPAGGISK